MNKDDNKKTHIIVTGKGGGGSGSTDWNDITNKPNFANVATSGDYDDLENKPEIPAAQVNSDWNAASGVAQILNKPTIPTKTSELTNDSGFTTFDGDYNSLTNKPDLATVATSGDYDDLQNKPTIPVVPTNVSAFTNDAGYTTFDGDYNSLTNKPTIPAAQVNSDWNASTGVSQILNKPSLATVATSGDYDDLQNKPTIPAAPVQSDWNEADSSSLAYIANKPTIPTVPAMTTQELTFTLQDGTVKKFNFYIEPNYFYVEDISGSDNTLSITKDNASAPTIEVFKSTDKVNWSSIGNTSTTAITATIPANGKLYLKATTNAWGANPYTAMGNVITVSGNHNVGGNIMSLLYGDSFTNQTTLNNYSFVKLFFNDTKLVNISNLELPATALTNQCYYQMFSGCTSLTTAPALPATTLATGCYYEMFNGCTSLTTAPELPATTLTDSCYNRMFGSCSSLTTAPELPATTLASECYKEMFRNCTSLTTAPALPATTLANYCYAGMLFGCSSLTTAPALPATTLVTSCYTEMFIRCSKLNNVTTYAQDISASNCLASWLSNVAATGDFYNLGGATYPSGTSGIPSGWTEHTSL